MKAGIWIIVLVIIAAGIGAYYWSKNTAGNKVICAKQGTGYSMNYGDAKKIASPSQCTQQGALKSNHWCNEITGTWWIDLNITKSGCSPACVVDVQTKQAEINWMCTGLQQ